jgi:hypothetical protein
LRYLILGDWLINPRIQGNENEPIGENGWFFLSAHILLFQEYPSVLGGFLDDFQGLANIKIIN